MTQDFNAVISQYGNLLSRVASTYEANDALKQELLQEIALSVWQGLSRFEGKSSLKTYILKIAHNRAVSHVASQVRRRDLVDMDSLPEVPVATDASPEKAFDQQQKMATLLRLVRKLPLQSRQVLTLSLEGLSYEEIAEVSGLTKSHVGVLLNRAKASVSRSFVNERS